MRCSAADIMFIFCFLRIATSPGRKRPSPDPGVYGIILIFLVLTPALLFFKGPALMI